MNKRERVPFLLLYFIVVVTFPIQKKEEKKTKSSYWSIPKLASCRADIVKILFPGSRESSPHRFSSSSLGGTFLFIFLSDPWNGSRVLDLPWGLPAVTAHFLLETDLRLNAYSKLFEFKIIIALVLWSQYYRKLPIYFFFSESSVSHIIQFFPRHNFRAVYFIACSPLYLILLFSLMLATSSLSESRWKEHIFNLIFAKVLSHYVCNWEASLGLQHTMSFKMTSLTFWWEEATGKWLFQLFLSPKWHNSILFYFSLLMCQLYIMVLIVLWFFH